MDIIDVIGDGNCYFRNLSIFFTGNENFYSFFRNITYIYIDKNKNYIYKNCPQVLLNDNFIDLNQYIPLINNDKQFAGDLEIGQSSILFKINIAIYTFDNINNKYKFYNYYNHGKDDFKYDLLLIIYDIQNVHYFQIKYKKIDINSINNTQNLKDNKDLFLINEIKNLIKKYKELDINEINHNLIKRIKNDNTFDSLIKKGYHYPEYPNHKYGRDLLYYIRDYKISIKQNCHKPIYPNYILEADVNKIDNLKRYFRKIASNYEIDDKDDLFIKYYDKKSGENKEYTLMKIPLVKNVNEFIYNIHKKLSHRNHNTVRNYCIKNNIFFKGITNAIKKIIKSCPICNLNLNIKLKKKEKSQLPKYLIFLLNFKTIYKRFYL